MGGANRLALTSACAALLGWSGAAFAQEAPLKDQPRAEDEQPVREPAPETPAQDNEKDDEDSDEAIVVVAEQADDARIDRRVYTLRDDPISQSSTMLDILARLPSVTVAPSGAVRLLGAENVVIQVDGQVVSSASLDAVLRSLSGSDIEKIEVITNPSAQFAANAGGGVINIITRQRFRLGLSGAVSAAGDSLGGYQLNASPTWTRGAWSYGLRAGGNVNKWRNANVIEREFFDTGETVIDRAHWEGSASAGLYGGGVLNFRNERRRASLNLWGWDVDSHTTPILTRFTDLGPLFTQTQRSQTAHSAGRAAFDFQQNGDSEGELFKFNIGLGSQEIQSDIDVELARANGDPTQRYVMPMANNSLTGAAKMDYERTIGEDSLLAAGWALDHVDEEISTSFETLSGPPVAPDFQSTLEGRQTIGAVYATYQLGVGEWTALPGVRFEHYRREIRSPGGEDDESRIDAFPSLHIRRNLAENLDLDFSYSRRIARPSIAQLDPAIRFWEATRASSGNPDLAPTMTDSIEANLVFQNSDRTYNLTFYDRSSEDIVSSLTEVRPDGVILTMPVNAGESRQRGLQAILRAPIAGNWRYSVSANLLNREFDVLSGGAVVRRSELEYSGNGQIEYRDRVQSAVGADHLQLEVQFQGPQYFLQGERDEFVVANFTWRRRIAEKVSAVFSVQDIFDSAGTTSQLRTDDFVERSERSGIGTRFRLQLTYQFGSLQNQGPPPDAGAPPFGQPTPQ
jgi:outer membrane receptor protein involved in Fe transport